MKIYIRTLLACLLLCAAMISIPVSCSKSEPERPAQGQQTQQPADPTLPQLTLDNAAALYAYAGESAKYNFKVTGQSAASAKISGGTCVNATIKAVEYNAQSRLGSITVELDKSSLEAGYATIAFTLSVGSKSIAYNYTITPYYIKVKESVTLPGEAGHETVEALVLGTNIPDLVPVISVNSKWVSYADGKLITLQENRTGDTREADINVNDPGNHFPGLAVKALQITLGPAPVAGCVVFQDWNFKKACVEIADKNGDNEVSFEEAEAVQELVVADKGIKDLTGLEAFRNVWKFDARNNDIEDATVLKELHLLHWMDLKGNKNLKTFDVTGCTIYFDHCDYEVTKDLKYYQLKRQLGISGKPTSDPYCEHSKHIRDERQTSDWSHQDNAVKIWEHTKNRIVDGVQMQYAFCVTGIGYIDVDIQDGSFKRIMTECIDKYFSQVPELAEIKDYVDIYYMEHCNKNRYEFMIPEDMVTDFYNSPEYKDADERYQQETHSLPEKVWISIFGEKSLQEGPLDKELFLAEFNIHCQPRQQGWRGWIYPADTHYIKGFRGKYHDIITETFCPYFDRNIESYYQFDSAPYAIDLEGNESFHNLFHTIW